ncbi:MAG: Outer rane lipoprotein, partial [Verrucomicrobiota bacterium]|nr:Outer rane lipoprotein [Verrucomicrobiota bacterium]
MRLRPWQLLTCSICFASNLLSQEVRRAIPVAPSPAPVPRAQPVYPDQTTGQPSILDERMPSAQSLEPRRPTESPKDARVSAGSPAEPDSKPKDADTDQDVIRLTPGQGTDAQSGDPAKAELAIADGLYIRKLYDLAVPEYEKYLGQFPGDSGRPSAMYRLADCYAKLGQEEPALN